MLLEKAVLRAPLRTTDEADRAARHVREHERSDRGIIVGEVALGRFRFGEDDAVAAAALHVAFRFRCGLLLFGSHVLCLLVAAPPAEARVEIGRASSRGRVCPYV